MKIVIEIPDEIYMDIKKERSIYGVDTKKIIMGLRGDYLSPRVSDPLLKAVQNGTPLPENHGRLIDADKLLLEHGDDITNWGKPYGVDDRNVEKAPTVLEGSE